MASPSLAARAAILGVPYQPNKRPDPLGVVKAIEALDAKAMATSAGAIVRDTLTDLNAVTNPPAHQMGWVTGDATAANNGIYENAGSPSAPNWQRRADLPFGTIHMINVGAGTPDAIVATSSLPVPTAIGAAILIVNIVAANTGNVTINGKPLRTNSGNEIAPGGLTAGSIHAFLDLGDHFRLLSNLEGEADVAAAEAARIAAEAARDAALGAAAGVSLPVISAEDEGKSLRVNAAGDGYELFTAPSPIADFSPLYLDQITTGFHGRGMLAAETNGIVTEQAITATSAAGASQITVASAANFLAGTNVTVKHDNGRYWTYWIYSKAGNALTIAPTLKWHVSAAGGAKAERAWYNRAHAGKFYIRQLAQRLVHGDELDMQIANRGRSFFTQFVDNASVANDQLTAFGGASVDYFEASSSNTGDTDWPVRFAQRSTAYITTANSGEGAASAAISVQPGTLHICRVITKMSANNLVAKVNVRALTDPVWTLADVLLPSGVDGSVLKITTMAFRVPIGVTSVNIRFENVSGAGAIGVSHIEVFPAEPKKGNVFQEQPTARIVVCGDSWVSGDEASTPERESIATALAAELPNATIINKGTGGSTIWDDLPNFQTIVAQENPDFVILHTGVNECYAPGSATFNPNHLNFFTQSMNHFINNCLGIGAKPIIIGTPALAEADSGSGYSDWLLNDRATLQDAWFYANL